MQAVNYELGLRQEGFRAEDIKAAEAMVMASRARVKSSKIACGDTKLYAPADGVIMTRIAESGSMLTAGQPVYSMYLANPIQIRAYVTEPQLGRVSVGMKAKIYTDAYPDEPFEGTVSFIAQNAEFTPKQVQTEDMRVDLVYRIRLLIPENTQDRLKNGMPVTVLLEK